MQSTNKSGFGYLRQAFADGPTVTTIPAACATDPVPWLSMAPTTRRANATLLMLARNSELYEAISSVKAMEDRFNRRYNYPWVFLNDEEFTDEFKS
jgi:alpha 1,2-mannosyltransferase